MRLEQVASENSVVIFDSSALHIYQEGNNQDNAAKSKICTEKTEALRFMKNYVRQFGGICISEMTFKRLKSGNFHYDPKGRRTDEAHFDLIKETPEERTSEYKLKRILKKENEARHSLADTLQIQSCVLQLTEVEKLLQAYFSEKYKKLKSDYALNDIQYDFLTTGFTVSAERGKTALVSNNSKLERFYLNVISSNGIVKPKNAIFYRRVENDVLRRISLK